MPSTLLFAIFSYARICSLSTLLLLISACSGIRFPGVYKVNVQQGNYLQQSKLDELKKGMTPNQVQYLLGTPLVQDTFNENRWDYFFSIKRGDTVFEKRKFAVFFAEGKVSGWEGDVKPRTEQELAELEKRRDAARAKQIDENVLTKQNIEQTNKEKGEPKLDESAAADSSEDAADDTAPKNTPENQAQENPGDQEVEETVQEAPFIEEAPGEHPEFDPSKEP